MEQEQQQMEGSHQVRRQDPVRSIIVCVASSLSAVCGVPSNTFPTTRSHVGLCDDELDAAREADAAWAARGMPRRNRDRLAAAEDDEPSDTEPVVIDAAEAARQRGERKRRRDANAAGGAAAAAGGGGGGGGGGG